MAAITATNLSNALRTYYGRQGLTRIIFGSEDRVLLNSLKKDESFKGATMPWPVYLEDAAGGRSAIFGDAQSNANSVQLARWDMDVVENHQVVQIENDALLRGRGEPGTFLKNQVLKIDASLNNLANDIEKSLFRSGTGAIGVTGTVTSTTIPLATIKDAKNFHIGQVLEASATETGALLSTSTTVTKVNFATGVLTVDTDITTPWNASGDYLFQQGDGQEGGSTAKKITGLDGWLTGTGTLFGQDRSTHSRLQGSSLAGSSSDIKKAIYDAAAQAKDLSQSRPRRAYMSWTVFGNLVDQLSTDVQRQPGESTTAGYSFVRIFGPSGPIECVGATFCQENVIWLIDPDTLTLLSMGDIVRIADYDGMMALRVSNAAALEVRADSHANLVCTAPIKNTKITLS